MTSPLRVYEYTLTPADALAYETLPRALGGWRFALLAIWLAASGGVLAVLPEAWIGPEGGWLFWLVGITLLGIAAMVAVAVITFATRLRARRLVPASREMRVEEWGDHFSIATEGRTSFIAFETVNVAIIGPAHLFVVAKPDVLIIPERAFADRTEMRPLARLLNDYDGESRSAASLPLEGRD